MGDIRRNLRVYGSVLSRWPDSGTEARAALLADPAFRGAWEGERTLDRALAEGREALDLEIARAGAVGRVRHETLARSAAGALAGMPWRRVAAAVLVAGALGGAVDLLLPPPDEPFEIAIGDPVYDLGAAELQ